MSIPQNGDSKISVRKSLNNISLPLSLHVFQAHQAIWNLPVHKVGKQKSRSPLETLQISVNFGKINFLDRHFPVERSSAGKFLTSSYAESLRAQWLIPLCTSSHTDFSGNTCIVRFCSERVMLVEAFCNRAFWSDPKPSPRGPCWLETYKVKDNLEEGRKCKVTKIKGHPDFLAVIQVK